MILGAKARPARAVWKTCPRAADRPRFFAGTVGRVVEPPPKLHRRSRTWRTQYRFDQHRRAGARIARETGGPYGVNPLSQPKSSPLTTVERISRVVAPPE